MTILAHKALEELEPKMRTEWGFPAGDIEKLVRTLIRNEEHYRSYGSGGAVADQYGKWANETQEHIDWWLNRCPGLRERIYG